MTIASRDRVLRAYIEMLFTHDLAPEAAIAAAAQSLGLPVEAVREAVDEFDRQLPW